MSLLTRAENPIVVDTPEPRSSLVAEPPSAVVVEPPSPMVAEPPSPMVAEPPPLEPSPSEPSVSADREDPEATRPPDDPVAGEFRAEFQVDSLAWPGGCTRLAMMAGDQVDQLATALIAGRQRGQRVVAIGGCRQGDGCTTLLLCTARRLVERGLKIVLVDADFENPLLARNLGLLPEVGWEEVLAGRLSVAEVVIESVQDHLSLVPLGSSASDAAGLNRGPAEIAANLDQLREHFDLVLVDLGAFPEVTQSSQPASHVAQWADAAVLVHNVRSTLPAELRQTRQRIQSAGLIEAGIAENFVDAGQPV